MYVGKVLNDKDAGIYLDNKIVCICPVEEVAQVLYIKNYWLEKEKEDQKQKAEKFHPRKRRLIWNSELRFWLLYY